MMKHRAARVVRTKNQSGQRILVDCQLARFQVFRSCLVGGSSSDIEVFRPHTDKLVAVGKAGLPDHGH
jgi:hypothetical protein